MTDKPDFHSLNAPIARERDAISYCFGILEAMGGDGGSERLRASHLAVP